jgi:hypothetical protein
VVLELAVGARTGLQPIRVAASSARIALGSGEELESHASTESIVERISAEVGGGFSSSRAYA